MTLVIDWLSIVFFRYVNNAPQFSDVTRVVSLYGNDGNSTHSQVQLINSLAVPALPAGVMLTRVSNSSIVLEAAYGLIPDAFETLLGSIRYTIGQQRYSMYASSGNLVRG